MFVDGAPIARSMAGSPILNANGKAMGVLSRTDVVAASVTGPHAVLLQRSLLGSFRQQFARRAKANSGPRLLTDAPLSVDGV